jgi:toxin ParE1/3/4
MKLVWRESAIEQFEQITDHISAHNLEAAAGLQLTIASFAEHLPQHPFMFWRGRVAGTREAILHPNYVLIYRVTADTVEIAGVVHTRQQYP